MVGDNMPETLTNCPFCHKLTIKILHIPFVSNTFKSRSRAGGRVTRYQKEKYNVLSGCDLCGKSKKEIERALNGPVKEISHEERIRRLKEAGLPIKLQF